MALSEELLRIVLLKSDINDILNWCQVSNLINIICSESFWEHKLNLSYPGYIGKVYENSYKKTVKLLYFGKYIGYEGWRSTTIRIDGKTSIYNIKGADCGWRLSYIMIGEYEGRPFQYTKHIGDNYWENIDNIVASGKTLLYTILLENGENAFVGAYKVTAVPRVPPEDYDP